VIYVIYSTLIFYYSISNVLKRDYALLILNGCLALNDILDIYIDSLFYGLRLSGIIVYYLLYFWTNEGIYGVLIAVWYF